MIRFGPAGIPLSCKGRTPREGLEDVHNLGLTAMEVQMVRLNVSERPANDDEAGTTPRDILGDLVVAVRRSEGGKERTICHPDWKVKAGDTLVTMKSGIASNYRELAWIGTVAKDLDIELSLHGPYYMDLAGAEALAERSAEALKWGGWIADAMGAAVVTTHLGLYGDYGAADALDRVAKSLKDVVKWYKAQKLAPKLGAETSGRQEVLGTMDEVLALCDKVDGLLPVLNFAHLHARENGALRRPEDFGAVFDKLDEWVNGRFHTHFSGVEHEAGNELRYTPIKRGDLRFEPLAEYLLDSDEDVTIISSSPLMEHDAVYMKVLLERTWAKKLQKGGGRPRKAS